MKFNWVPTFSAKLYSFHKKFATEIFDPNFRKLLHGRSPKRTRQSEAQSLFFKNMLSITLFEVRLIGRKPYKTA